MPQRFHQAWKEFLHSKNKSKSREQTSSRNPPAQPLSKQHPDTATGVSNASDPIPPILPQTSHAPPTPFTSIWDEAYAQFKHNHPEVLETFEAFLTRPEPAGDDEIQAAVDGVKNTTGLERFKKIVEVLNKKEGAVNDARWKFKWGEREIVMRDQVKQVADKVLLAKDLIGQVASHEPHAAIVWAGIATLLPLLTNPALQAAAAIDGLEFVCELVSRYRLVERRYFGSPEAAQKDAVLQDVAVKAREKMVDIYSQVFGYVIRLSIRFATNKFITALRDTIKADDWKQLLDQIQGDVESADGLFKELNHEVFNQTLKDMKDNMGRMRAAQIKIGLATRLEVASAATYDTSGLVHDSGSSENELYCLPGTRQSLMREICDWADKSHGSMFLWLRGSAGTGKSTILRTVARNLDKEKRLGGNFFFKRGGGDRGVSTKLFTTLAIQLAHQIPDLEREIANALDGHNGLSLSPQQQFRELLLRPLSKLEKLGLRSPTFFLVMDALDECESETSAAGIVLQCLAQLDELPSCRIRVLFTSRPDPYIRKMAHEIDPNTFEERDLEEEQTTTIKADIELFLNHRFEQMRKDPNNPTLANANDWPGEECICWLRDRAVPLFIFASTVCRYIAGPGSRTKLRDILASSDMLSSGAFTLRDMYRVILDQLVNYPDQREQRIAVVLKIAGSIALLSSPLPKAAAAELIGIPLDDLADQLPSLAAVLRVPEDENAPLQMYHLSFRDFLVSNDSAGGVRNPYHVNEAGTHGNLTARCLDLLKNAWTTREPLCSWNMPPGTIRSSVDRDQVDRWIKPELAYASSFWVDHLKGSGKMITDCGPVHDFLKANFLHWLEALAWLSRLSSAIDHINDLLRLVDKQNSTKLLAFLQDARRFVLRNRHVVDIAPQQAYTSALIFTPSASVIRQHFCEAYRDKWPRITPKVPQDWSPETQTLEGHEDRVRAVAFSADNRLLASSSYDGTIKVWDAKSGEEKYNLKGHTDCVNAVLFLPSGMLVSGSHDKTVRFWDTKTGKEIKRIPHDSWVFTLALSPLPASTNSQLLAIGSQDKDIKIWDSGTGTEGEKLVGHSDWVVAVAFSPLPSVTQVLASASHDQTVRLWDVKTGVEIRTMEGHEGAVNAVAFSSNGELLASASNDNTVRLWDTQTGSAMRKLEGHSDPILAVAFSTSWSDSQILVSASVDKSIRLWNTGTGEETRKLEGHHEQINGIAFSPDGKLFASGSHDTTCRLWDMKLGGRPQKVEGHSGLVSWVVFSPDGQVVVSVSPEDKVIRTWNPQTGGELKHFEGHNNGFIDVAFSPDGQTLASQSYDQTMKVWNVRTGNEIYSLNSWARAIAFSPNGKKLAAALPFDGEIMIWDVETGTLSRKLKYAVGVVDRLVFSPDGRLLTVVPLDCEAIKLLDVDSGKMQRLKGSHGSCTALAFSPDSRVIASASVGVIKLWYTKTGKEKQDFRDVETGSDLELEIEGLEGTSDLDWSDSELGIEELDGASEPADDDIGSDLELENSPEAPQKAYVAFPTDSDRAVEQIRAAQKLWIEYHRMEDIRALAFSPDCKVLALASNGHPVRLWDVESREIMQDPGKYNKYTVTLLSSREEYTRIIDFTVCGMAEHTSCSHETVPRETSAITILEIKNQWLRYLGQDVLWLPQEFRGSCWSVSGHQIAIGQHSGSVSFFRFH